MKHRLLYCLISILLFQPHYQSLYAQQYNFKYFNAKNGLAGSAINDIQQDQQGNIWFATLEGAVRFDGKTFRTFTKNDGLIGNVVLDLCLDKAGNVWFATEEGVSKYDGISFTNYTIKNGLVDNYVYSIYCDSKGVLWFATWRGGISIYDGKTFSRLTMKDGLPVNFILSILQDASGNYWFGTKGAGLCKYDGKQITTFTKKDGLRSNDIFYLLQDHTGKIWIGTNEGGIDSYYENKFSALSANDISNQDPISRIIEDKRGNIWFGTQHGALKLTSGKKYFFTEKEGLNSNKIGALFEDYEGNIWIGGSGGGACMLKSEAFINYTEKEGLEKKDVACTTEDSHGSVLIGTTEGLFQFNPKISADIQELPLLGKNNITALLLDKKGLLWIGTNFSGIFVLRNQDGKYVLEKRIENFGTKGSVVIMKMLEDKKGNKWFGAYDAGIYLLKPDKSVIHLDTSNGLISNFVQSLFMDKSQNLWIGTKAGLQKYNGSTFQSFTNTEGLPENSITNITEDNNENIFIGTSSSGVALFSKNKFYLITTKQGLSSNFISGLLCDDKNQIWVGTNKGLNRFDLSKSSVNELVCKTYTDQQGFSASGVNADAMYKDASGAIWIGSPEGLIHYNPALDFPSIIPPKIDIAEVKLFNETVNWKKLGHKTDEKAGLPVNPELNYQSNYLSFVFRAYTTGTALYRYKLDGLDGKWSPAKEYNEAVYPSIPPGTYTLNVIACNSDGIWTPHAITFTFTILPPWYRTWWFYISFFIVLGSSIFLFIKLRTRQLTKEKEFLEQTVTERTSEIVLQKKEIETKNHEITDSINYAKRIQNAILPPAKLFKEALPESFVLFKPKDIVSGDFYWLEKVGDKVLYAAVDCTGHGVPGAMVSVVGHNGLNRAVKEFGLTEPAAILDKLTQLVEETFERSESEVKDGMDISLCCLDASALTLEWSGANNPIWIIRDGKIIPIKPDKQPIGKFDYRKPFTNHLFNLKKGDSIYVFTDGFADQFGGPKGKKFKYKQLEELLIGIQSVSMEEQKTALDKAYENWRGDLEQIDDVCIIGVKI